MLLSLANAGGQSGASAGASSSDTAAAAEPTSGSTSTVSKALEWMHNLPSMCAMFTCQLSLPFYHYGCKISRNLTLGGNFWKVTPHSKYYR